MTQIELLKWMLEDVRKVTLAGISHLTKEQLFTPPIEGEFPIGAHLMHIAANELGWLHFISGVEQSADIKKRSYYGKWLSGQGSDPPKEALEVKEYFDVMTTARKLFVEYISTLSDPDLEEFIIRKKPGGEKRYLKKWIVYHLIEHEAHHRGQMFMLIRKAGWNKK